MSSTLCAPMCPCISDQGPNTKHLSVNRPENRNGLFLKDVMVWMRHVPCWPLCLNTWSLVGGDVLGGWIASGKLGLVGGRGMLGLGPWVIGAIRGPDYNMRASLSQPWALMTVPCPFLPWTLLLNKASHSQTGWLNIFLNLVLALDATFNSAFSHETWSPSLPLQQMALPSNWSLKILLSSWYLTFISYLQSIKKGYYIKLGTGPSFFTICFLPDKSHTKAKQSNSNN